MTCRTTIPPVLPALNFLAPFQRPETTNPHLGRLERTLVGLCRRSLPTTRWEFVLVDNASTIPLDARGLGLARFANWRLVREQRLGTVFGRGDENLMVTTHPSAAV